MPLLNSKVSGLLKSTLEKSEALVKSVVETGDSLVKGAVAISKNTMDKHKDMSQVSALRKKIKELEKLIVEKKAEIGDYYYDIFNTSVCIDDESIASACRRMSDISHKAEALEKEVLKIKGISTNTDFLNALSTGAIAVTPEIIKFAEEAGVLREIDSSMKEAILKGILEISKSCSATESTHKLLEA